MVKRTSMLLAVLTIVLFAGSSREARAALSCNQCSIACTNSCSQDGGCASYGASDCSGGVGTCYWTCNNGSYGYQDCGCGSGGSPIFKKKPIEPAPGENSSKRSVKPVQATKPTQAAKTLQPANPVASEKPVQPEAAIPAQSE